MAVHYRDLLRHKTSESLYIFNESIFIAAYNMHHRYNKHEARRSALTSLNGAKITNLAMYNNSDYLSDLAPCAE